MVIAVRLRRLVHWNPSISFEDMIAEMLNIELLDDAD